MKILVRLPNWLGDMVMSTGFLKALKIEFPSARIDVIVKKGLESLVNFIPEINNHYMFSKAEWKGLSGAYRFGKKIKKENRYDLFFCLPDSFSSAFMGWATSAKQRIGFKKELRSLFLTRSFRKPSSLHRVEEYVSLLEQFRNKQLASISVSLKKPGAAFQNKIIINFNSEAGSRRMPVIKAASIFNGLIKEIPGAEFIFIGSMKDKDYIDEILKRVDQNPRINNKTGQTSDLSDLIELIASGAAMLTTDSGPAHLANALGVPTVVTFGAGNENSTAPYNKEGLTVLRLGQLPCEPCLKNVCKFGSPKCLEQLDADRIVSEVKKFMGF
ncbi:MAG: lipopolysaccharide heptosyltransferase II [Chitinophagales bacterium]